MDLHTEAFELCKQVLMNTPVWGYTVLALPIIFGHMPASAQMTESPINTNTMNGRMRVEGRVTRPFKSTPTEHRYVTVMKDDEE